MNKIRIFSLALATLLCALSLPAQTQPGKAESAQKPPAKPPAAPPQAPVQKTPTTTTAKPPVLPAAVAPDNADYFAAPDAEAFSPKPVDTTTAPTTIAFGSCNKMTFPQGHWSQVAANNPNLWVWLGDIIYADTTNMKALAKHYRSLKTQPDYKKLRAKAQIIGVYDDHDFGQNDACKDYPKKKESKKCLMDFMDIPNQSAIRKREGAYQSYTFGKGAQSVKVIILDTRYFRDALEPDPSKQKRYLPNASGTVLGEAQWKWLEKELRTSKAGLTLLCSSVQVIADEQPYEKWGNFPNERKRLLNLISQTKPNNLLIISGDRHMSEVSKMSLEGLPYPLYDFTSSGLTHVRSGNTEANHFRVGDMMVKKNFGVLKIQWNGEKPVVSLQTRGANDNALLQEIVVKY
jgi:alkaline phosphatase D